MRQPQKGLYTLVKAHKLLIIRVLNKQLIVEDVDGDRISPSVQR